MNHVIIIASNNYLMKPNLLPLTTAFRMTTESFTTAVPSSQSPSKNISEKIFAKDTVESQGQL